MDRVTADQVIKGCVIAKRDCTRFNYSQWLIKANFFYWEPIWFMQ